LAILKPGIGRKKLGEKKADQLLPRATETINEWLCGKQNDCLILIVWVAGWQPFFMPMWLIQQKVNSLNEY